MFKIPFVGRCAAALIILSLSITPVAALTAEEVMTNMSDEQRHAFIAGSVEMAALMFHLQGEREKASCILDWFFEGGDGPRQMIQALTHFSDRPSHPVMLTLINRTCGQEN